MAQIRSRSGNVALDGLSVAGRHQIDTSLSKARFGVDDLATSEVPQVIMIGLETAGDVAGHVLRLSSRFPNTALIGVLEGGGTQLLLSAFRAGITDAVVIGETSESDLVATVKLAIERKRIEVAAAATSEKFTLELGRRARHLKSALDQVETAYQETLHALVRALDVREKATAGHSVRVAYYCCYLAGAMGVPDEEMEDLYRGALLHDIGKIGIPDAILLKPGKLDDEEFTIMKTHSALGKSFLEGVGYLQRAVAIPYAHHEKWNGKGYPRGLSGEDIPLSARIFAIVDVYDALRSKRSYKEPFTHEKSIQIITEDTGTHFDPGVAAAFLEQDQDVWMELDEASRESADFADMKRTCQRLLQRRALIAGATTEDDE